MPTLTFSFDTGPVPLSRIVDAVAYKNGYTDTVRNPSNPAEAISNPETKAQFARRMVRQYIVQAVHAYETQIAAKVAADAVEKVSLT